MNTALIREGNVPVVGISHHAHLALDGSNFLLRGRLSAAHSEERHLGGCVRVMMKRECGVYGRVAGTLIDALVLMFEMMVLGDGRSCCRWSLMIY